MNKCEFRGGREAGRRKRNGSSYKSLISWSDTILREMSTFSSVFPKGHPATQPVRCYLGYPGASLMSIYKWNSKPKQQAFPLVSILPIHALPAVKAGTEKASAWMKNACPTVCAGDPPLPQASPQEDPDAHMWASVPSKPLVTTLAVSLQTVHGATHDTQTLARSGASKSRRNHNTPETPWRTMTSAGREQTDRQSRQTLPRPCCFWCNTNVFH